MNKIQYYNQKNKMFITLKHYKNITPIYNII